MSEPREYTEQEEKQMLIKKIWALIGYWEKLEGDYNTRYRLEGLAHSILANLDGCGMDLPGYMIVPMGQSCDTEYHKDQGENWHREPPDGHDLLDIGGGLHEIFHKIGRDAGYIK